MVVPGPIVWGQQNGFPFSVQLIDKHVDHVRAGSIWLEQRGFEHRSWTFVDFPSIFLFKVEQEAIEFRINFG